MQNDQARNEVIEVTRKFFRTSEVGKKREFIPGKTYIPVTAKTLDENDLVHLVDASLDLWLTAGRFAREFEKRLPEYFARKIPALLVNSGSSANLLALSSLGANMMDDLKLRPIEKGEEVITLAAGFPTTVNPIVQNGWKPVFIDIDTQTLNALPEAVMNARTEKTRAVILAHTLGNPYRADVLADWCKKEGIYLIEDCCDALGATLLEEKKPVGSFGDFATVSFYPAHHITMGEGGAVLARNPRFRRIAESLRDWGRDCWCEPGNDNTCGKRFQWKLGDLPEGYDHKYVYSNIGYNLKVTDMQAAIGLSQLEKVPQFIESRRRHWQQLYNGIQNSPILSDHFIPVEPTPESDPSWFGFPIHCVEKLDRNRVVAFLEKERKVGTRLLFASNLTKQPAYRNIDFKMVGDLKNTDRVLQSTFWIGVHPGLDSQQIDYMLESLEASVKKFSTNLS